MEYIRSFKASHESKYIPNTRHCIYGLDADLIMLGLLSHEPHTCLLREQVVFGKSRAKARGAKSTEEHLFPTFDLLHLSMLREYLDIEFKSLFTDDTLSFEYDPERIIDDFILLAVMIGNDFTPHLPALHIHANTRIWNLDLLR